MTDQSHDNAPPATGSSFATLNDAHADLEELFLVHQECLVVGAFAAAGELLAAYRALIELHMEHEEQRVLPIYERAATKRWPAELYTGQHKKILALLDRIEPALRKLDKRPGWRRGVIELLEVETTLKHLLEHHHLAEDQVFYPVSDEHADEEARRQILDACRDEWAQAMERHANTLMLARTQLSD